MRRRYVAALAGAALAAGLASAGPATAQQDATYAEARAQLEQSVHVFRNQVVYRVFDERPARQRGLRRNVARYDRALTRIEELEESGGTPMSPLELADLREAEEHMRAYLEALLGGDRQRMQITTWRFLWALNGLPLSLSR